MAIDEVFQPIGDENKRAGGVHFQRLAQEQRGGPEDQRRSDEQNEQIRIGVVSQGEQKDGAKVHQMRQKTPKAVRTAVEDVTLAHHAAESEDRDQLGQGDEQHHRQNRRDETVGDFSKSHSIRLVAKIE